MSGLLKSVSHLTLLNNLINNVVKRSYAVIPIKSDLKIKWTRPEKESFCSPGKTGDQGLDMKTNETDYVYGADMSEEIKDAPEIVKKMFTLEFAKAVEKNRLDREKTIALVRRHDSDRGSREAQIGWLTNEILHWREYLNRHPRNKIIKSSLNLMIQRRKKYLRCLRQSDYRKFEWLLDRLNLIYKPDPFWFDRVERKKSMRKLTAKYCEETVKKKLDAYRDELEKQHKDFFQEKLDQLLFIQAEEKSLGLESSITEEEIEEARKKVAELEVKQSE